jgi:hypothetical protein
LIEHFQLAEKVMKKALLLQPLLLLNEFKFYVSKTLLQLRRGILAEDEGAILKISKKQVEPLFAHQEQHNAEPRPVVATYFAALDP